MTIGFRDTLFRMTRLFSYVVQHDLGFAPNPSSGICTLAKCKCGGKRRNIVELAERGDWIAGTGGADLCLSAGHGKMIYAMKVDDKIPLREYCRGNRGRIDAGHEDDEDSRFALLSTLFYYFGRNAVNISGIPKKNLDHPFEKTGPGFRSDFSREFIDDFVRWLRTTFKRGIHGPPCQPFNDDTEIPKCPPHVRRK